MVSKAREDFPEPLTPVTTVMALCGVSTLMVLRLWTRAPRTRMDSCSGLISVVAGVISFVAKRKPRQRVSSVLPKLQIIRPLAKQGKRRIFVRICVGEFAWQIHGSWVRGSCPIPPCTFRLIVAEDVPYSSLV